MTLNEIEAWITDNFNVNQLVLTEVNGCIIAHANYAIICDSAVSLTNGKFTWGNVSYFDCSGCTNLTSLQGTPKKCDELICSNCSNLASLKGAPKKCFSLRCIECENLVDMTYAPLCYEAHISKTTNVKGLSLTTQIYY